MHALNLSDVRGHERIRVAVPTAEDNLPLSQLSTLAHRQLGITLTLLFSLDLTQLLTELVVAETHVEVSYKPLPLMKIV